MSKELKALTRARSLIEQGWTKGSMAKSAAGRGVIRTSVDAVCWCAEGALGKACAELGVPYDVVWAMTDKISQLKHKKCPWVFNDYVAKTKEEVIEIFDLAIAEFTNKGVAQ